MKWLTFSNHIFKWILLNKYVFDSNVIDILSCDQAALWMVPSVCLSVRLSVHPSIRLPVTLFYYVPIIVSSWNFQELLPMTEVKSMQKVKVRGQRSRSQRSTSDLAVSGSWLQFEFTYDVEMMHRAWYCLEEVRYCFSRSSVKFQGLKAKNIVDFDQNSTFLDCNSSLNSLMAMKWWNEAT